MRKFDLSLRSSRSSYFATFRHQLTILSKTDALDEEKWLNMLGTFVKDWFRYRSEERFSRNAETDLVCRLLLEKKKKKETIGHPPAEVLCSELEKGDQPTVKRRVALVVRDHVALRSVTATV